MPVISALKEENQYLQQQKSRMSDELSQLYELSTMVAAENEAMRQHYHQRTIDLQQLIGTITTNSNLNMDDLNHLRFLNL